MSKCVNWYICDFLIEGPTPPLGVFGTFPKEKIWELTGELECNGFHISLLPTNTQSAVIGTRIVFCPEKFVMRADITKKRMKHVQLHGLMEKRRRHLKT